MKVNTSTVHMVGKYWEDTGEKRAGHTGMAQCRVQPSQARTLLQFKQCRCVEMSYMIMSFLRDSKLMFVTSPLKNNTHNVFDDISSTLKTLYLLGLTFLKRLNSTFLC